MLWRYGVLFVEVFPCGVGDAFCDCLFFCFSLYGSTPSSFQYSAVSWILI